MNLDNVTQKRRANMKAPDKIYVNIPWDYWRPAADDKLSTDTEYIRKDALLEWAKELKERWEEPPMSKHSPGCVYMLEQLIDKLNSL